MVEDVYAGIVRDMERILGAEGATADRLRNGFVRLGNATDLELDVIRLIAREALSSSTRLRKIVSRFHEGSRPLLIETIAQGVRAGEFDPAVPAPFVLLAIMGLGGLPQFVRRSSRAVPFFSALPRAEALADISIDVLFRAVGAPKAGAKRASPVRRPSRAR